MSCTYCNTLFFSSFVLGDACDRCLDMNDSRVYGGVRDLSMMLNIYIYRQSNCPSFVSRPDPINCSRPNRVLHNLAGVQSGYKSRPIGSELNRK